MAKKKAEERTNPSGMLAGWLKVGDKLSVEEGAFGFIITLGVDEHNYYKVREVGEDYFVADWMEGGIMTYQKATAKRRLVMPFRMIQEIILEKKRS